MKKMESEKGRIYNRKSFLDYPCCVVYVQYNHTVALMDEANQTHLLTHYYNSTENVSKENEIMHI
jgi:hypothetical protein